MVDWGGTAAEALAEGRWRQAVAGFEEVLSGGDDPRAWEGLAQAHWWLDEGAESLRAREAAYRGYRDRGDDRSAARAALSLGYDAVLFGQGRAVGRGWLSRAADLLAGLEMSPEHGWLAVRQSETALVVDHDARAALEAAEQATVIGDATGDSDLTVVGRALAGLSQVRLGDVDAGMPRLDAAVAAATAGDVADLMWMGKICCWLIMACQETRDLARAGEWCERVQVICETRDLAPLFTVCRIQYASLQIAWGDAAEAESTLADVMQQMASSRRVTRLDAVIQLGELRRRQGRHAEAEALLRQAEFNPTALVSLALVRHAQGDAARAWSTLCDVLARLGEPLDRVDALGSAIEVLVDLGRVEEARSCARELRAIAERAGTDPLLASAAAAEAVLADPADAPRRWREAVRRFSVAGLRFDEADARLRLAEALRAVGDVTGAREHVEAAMSTCADLGAAGALARAQRLHTRLGPGRRGPLTERQTEVLRLVAGGHTNAEIAARLHLSEHTVHRHVANILTALGLSSRAAATAYATGHDLI